MIDAIGKPGRVGGQRGSTLWPCLGRHCSLPGRADHRETRQHGYPSCARGFFVPFSRARPRSAPDIPREVTMSEASDIPPFRYTATLAGEIEVRWQDYWEEHGTFRAPNPVGPLADPDHPRAGAPKMYVM